MTDAGTGSRHVLISHDRRDEQYARELEEFLARRGVPAQRSGDDAWEESDAAVEASSALIVVMTPAAEDSERVNREITKAQAEELPIFPVLLKGDPFFRFGERYPIERPAGHQRIPGAAFARKVRRAMGGGQRPGSRPGPWRTAAAAVALAIGAVLMIVIGTVLFVNRDGKVPTDGASQSTTPAPSGVSPTSAPPTAAGPLAPGTVSIDSPTAGAVVGRCVRVSGRANLDPGKTMLFATNRVDPPASEWFYTYAGGHRNGLVPPDWTGQVYLGSATLQSYDVFVIVMDVAAAEAFWTANKSLNGEFAFTKTRPPVPLSAKVQLRQGSMDECRP